MFSFSHLRRRVSISHAPGMLRVRIAPHNQKTLYLFSLLPLTAAFLFGCSIFLPPFLRNLSLVTALCAFLFFALLTAAFILVLSRVLWCAFGVEEIVVENGVLRWAETALWWNRKLETATAGISRLEAITPRYSRSNCVEFTSHGRRYQIGDSLLRDEAVELAHALEHALGLR